MNQPVQHLDTAILDNLRKLLEEGLDEVLQEFLADSQEQVERLVQAAEAGDLEALVTVAHTLKGSSGNLGVTLLYRQCEALEQDGRKGTLSDPIARVEVLQQVYSEAVEALTDYMHS